MLIIEKKEIYICAYLTQGGQCIICLDIVSEKDKTHVSEFWLGFCKETPSDNLINQSGSALLQV